MTNGQFNGSEPRGGRGAPQPRGSRPRRSPLQALVYWSAVLGVWGLIFLVAFLAVFATDLPDTSKIFDVKRQPSTSSLDRSGGLVAVGGNPHEIARAACA